ncbi:hypothetical protein M0R45_013098 [Rubus argutus]|uniref:Pre-mRNA-splicing factor SYF1 n=1 Tax=Rubus argutus TaxID=59490 RepID=A0AAW1XH69_RUBAR
MSISQDLYPSPDDLVYEEELLRNPYNIKLWWRYLTARSESPFKKRRIIYERALKALPGSYKLWHAYLEERIEHARNFPIDHSKYEALNNTFRRALVTMHKMPEIWLLYLQSLTDQEFITSTRRTFDRALCALPEDRNSSTTAFGSSTWPSLAKRIFRSRPRLGFYGRCLQFDPTHVEDYINFLINSSLWQEAVEMLALVLNGDDLVSVKGKTKHTLWLELCDLLAKHTIEARASMWML